jgi:hypothetical protein
MKKILFAAVFLFPVTLFAQKVSDSAVYDITDIPRDQDNGRIVIARNNHDHLVITAVADETDSLAVLAYYSNDRGGTWHTSRLPRATSSDFYPGASPSPSIASDMNGNLFIAYATNGVDDLGYLSDSSGDISIVTSSDAGSTWKNLTAINNNFVNPGSPQTPFLTVDNSPSSSHQGRIYIAWDQFYSNTDRNDTSGGLYISWSDDKGQHWTTPKFLGVSDGYQEIHTGKNGEIYVATSDSSITNNGHQLFFSNNGGASFSQPLIIGGFTSYPFFIAGVDTGETGLKGLTGFPAQTYISFDVDEATNRIYAVYADWQDPDAVLYYKFSDDNGTTWSSPVGISELTGNDADRFDPSVVVDQKAHQTWVSFYSSASDVNNVKIAPARANLSDLIEKQISPQYNPLVVEIANGAPYIGDHTSADAYDNVFASTWTQNRQGYFDGDIWAFVSSSGANDVQPVLVHSSHSWLSAPYPNPARKKEITLHYFSPATSDVSFDLFDAIGRHVKHFSDFRSEEGPSSIVLNIDNIPSGSYIIRLKTEDEVFDQKLVIDK